MRSFLIRQFRSVAPIFQPPFDGLWIVALLYYFWCFLVHPQGQILRGNLPDPDDYMYLDQVLDWIKGQGWYDHLQHRLDPPDGGLIHFSRLAMIPMAALILFFKLLGLPPVGAATVMAIIYPVILFAGFFLAVRWLAESFVPKEWVGASAYVAMFPFGIMALFAPGHVDHHGLILILMTLVLGCCVRMMQKPEDIRWGLAAGVIFALALTVALEVLPWIIVMSGWLGLWAIIKGGKAARNGLAFGLALYLASLVFLLLTRPPSGLLEEDVVAYSIVYIYFTGSIAAIFAAIALAGQAHTGWRWLFAIGVTSITASLFLSHFPSLLTGPWGGVNPALAHLILDNVNEAAPLAKIKGSLFKNFITALGPLIAFGVCWRFIRKDRPSEQWAWSLLTVMLVAAFLLTFFYQYRFVGVLGLLTIVPLTVLLQRGWRWIAAHEQGRRKVYAEIGLLLLVGPLPAVIAPALTDGRSFNTGMLMFPVHTGPSGVCDMYGLEKVLRAPEIYKGTPRTIMNTMGLGPELLFRSPHKVISAPYHEDVSGNLDSVRFFATSDTAKAETIVRQRHADLIVSCKLIPGMYTDLGAIKQLMPDIDSKPKSSAEAEPPMILRLITGQQLPPWANPIRSPSMTNYVVYEIAPPSSSRSSGERE